MKSEERENNSFTSVHVWGLLEELEEGDLDAEARDKLFGLLESCPEARSVYLEYFELGALLQFESKLQRERGTLPYVGGQLRHRRMIRHSLLAAAALLILLASIAALVRSIQPQSESSELEVVAGSIWKIKSSDGTVSDSDNFISDGSTINVLSGTVATELESGHLLIIQGPAQVTFPTLAEPKLEFGWLWVDGSHDSKGEPIRVEAPGGWIREIGTRFGVYVDREGGTEVHLWEGKVEAQAKKDGGVRLIDVIGTASVVFAETNEIPEITVAPDPFPGLASLLGVKLSYPTTIMGQSPVGYWRLGARGTKEDVFNLVRSGSVGFINPKKGAIAPVAGVGPEDGFRGFEESNEGVRLKGGNNPHSLIGGIGSPAGVSTKNGSVSFWFLRKPGLKKAEVLWYAGDMFGNGFGPNQEMHFYLSRNGKIHFFIEDGRSDLLLSGRKKYADGRWHHVTASWSPKLIEMFVDGKKIAQDLYQRDSGFVTFSEEEVRFGKSGKKRAMGNRKLGLFSGVVDEIALWSRPLTHVEVKRQYHSALGRKE